jgi:hypothetical protein
MKRIIFAAVLALFATLVSAQQAVSVKVSIDGAEHTVSLPPDAVWAVWYAMNGASSTIHLVPGTSLRIPTGDVLTMTADGAIYRNAVRLGATATAAEVVVVGNAFYARAKGTDTSKLSSWNNVLNKWELVSSLVDKGQLTPLPTGTSASRASPTRFASR